MNTHIHHVGLAVHDVGAAATYYERHYGLAVVADHISDVDGVHELMLAAGDSYLQLLEPTRPDSPIGRFLARRGPGIHHLALAVADAVVTLDSLSSAGARLIDDRPRVGTAGHRIAFVHPHGAMGALTELVEDTDAKHPA